MSFPVRPVDRLHLLQYTPARFPGQPAVQFCSSARNCFGVLQWPKFLPSCATMCSHWLSRREQTCRIVAKMDCVGRMPISMLPRAGGAGAATWSNVFRGIVGPPLGWTAAPGSPTAVTRRCRDHGCSRVTRGWRAAPAHRCAAAGRARLTVLALL